MLKDFEDPKSQNFEDFRKFENHGIFKFRKFQKSQNFEISKMFLWTLRRRARVSYRAPARCAPPPITLGPSLTGGGTALA